MAGETIITINGTDVGPNGLAVAHSWRTYLYKGELTRNRAEILVNKNILNSFIPTLNQSVTITRGETTGAEYNIFEGLIAGIEEDDQGLLRFTCRDPLWRLQFKFLTKSYDINIDTEAGVISDIWTDIAEDGGITVSAVDSGTTNVLQKFICNDNNRLERMQTLTATLNWQMYYDFINSQVVLEPPGTTVFGTTLTVGGNVVNTPVWKDDLTNMRNNIKINGANSLGVQTEGYSGTGIATEFLLSEEPEDTKVTVDGDEKLRGVPDSTTTFDYYIDKVLKKVIFLVAPPSDTGNVIIEYSYKIPIPVIQKRQSSIDLYGEQEEVFNFDDLDTVDDAILRLNGFLDNLSIPPTSTQVQTTNVEGVYPGFEVSIVDPIANRNEQLIVDSVVYQWPESFDLINVGTDVFDTQKYIDNIQTRISKLEQKESINEGILNQIIQFDNLVDVRQVFEIWRTSPEADVLYWDDDNQGTWGNDAGSTGYNWGDDTDETEILSQRAHTNNKYFEDFYDDDLVDNTNTTAQINTTDHQVEF